MNSNMPSGCEVESAAFHTPVSGGETISTPERSGIRGKLDGLKSRGLAKVHVMQRSLSDRSSMVKRSMVDGTKSQVTKMQSSMRTNPTKWVGVAAGSGFALGLLGRIMHARSRRAMRMPDLVIIESSC